MLALSEISLSQHESGRLTTLAFGTGVSSHAGSYTINEVFRTKEFSGFRALIIESKLGWNFWETTSLYGVARLSLPNSIISPYRSIYFGFGLSQTIPGVNSMYLISNYGKYKSTLDEGVQAGKGNLLNLGVGLRVDDNLFFELNNTFGKLSNIDESLNISPEESQWFFMVSFKF